MHSDRSLDVTVFGATGFVGKLIAAYLAEHAPEGTRIGLAGRSEEKLAKARGDLPKRAADWPLIVADSSDRESLRKLAEGTQVVATTVGPYHRSGMALVDACAAAGTDYADLTGRGCSCTSVPSTSTSRRRRPAPGSCTPVASTRSPRTWACTPSTSACRPTAPASSRRPR